MTDLTTTSPVLLLYSTAPVSLRLDYVIDFHDHSESHDNFESLSETGLAS